MSLLMDALRKAEEAKRLSAKRELEGRKEADAAVAQLHELPYELALEMASSSAKAPAPLSEFSTESVADSPFAIQAIEEPGSEVDALVLSALSFEFVQEIPSGGSLSQVALDTPLEFEIDESFGLTPQPSARAAVEFSLSEWEIEPVVEPPAKLMPDSVRDQDSAPEFAIDFEQASVPQSIPEVVLATLDKAGIQQKVEPITASRGDDGWKPKATVTMPQGQKVKQSAAADTLRRQSARALFSAKSVPKSRRLLLIVGIAALLPIGGGVYLGLQMLGLLGTGNQYNIPSDYDANTRRSFEAPEQPDIADSTTILPDVVQENVLTAEIASADTGSLTSVPDAGPVMTDIPVAVAALESVDAASQIVENVVAADESAAVPLIPSEVEQMAEQPRQSMVAVGPLAPAAASINITRSESGPQIDPQVSMAYAAYQDGDFLGARAQYQQALRTTPNSRDAMLGLAAVSMQLGDATTARIHYTRLLELDPRDALARVGLMGTIPASDSVQLESELKSLFAAHPDVAPLAFSLGNLYAEQGRWNEAQQSYYDALLAAKAGGTVQISPDYAFNLAVSLERLNQLQSAYNFYREAEDSSRITTPAFDPRVLRDRIDALERALP